MAATHASSPATRTVYRERGRVSEKCSHGCSHDVTYAEVKTLTETGETREHDNGYEKSQTPLFVDAQGRTYHQHVSIDFFNNISYRRDADGVRFTPRLRTGPARDLLGNPLNNDTPAGPPWPWEAQTAGAHR